MTRGRKNEVPCSRPLACRRIKPIQIFCVSVSGIFLLWLRLNYFVLTHNGEDFLASTPSAEQEVLGSSGNNKMLPSLSAPANLHQSLKKAPREVPEQPCALLFFGAPRLFKHIVLPSIRKYIINNNPHCDIYLHTYNVTKISTIRSQEKSNSLAPNDVYDLTDNVVMDTMEEFHAQRNLTFYRQHHHEDDGWGECCDSTDNLIKQWHSIDAVWRLMQKAEKRKLDALGKNDTKEHYYERVGLFRSDVFYTNPINIMDPTEPAVVPNWVFKNRKTVGVEEVVNDRMFYGSYNNARVWATERFSFAPYYVHHYRRVEEGRKQGLHSETFLYTLLVKVWKMALAKRPICFWRTRASGMIMTIDCKVPSSEGVEGTIQDAEDWDILKNSTCCWDCRAVEYKKRHWGPCTPEAQRQIQDHHTFLE